MFCSQCGKSNENSARFCTGCGSPFKAETAVPVAAKVESSVASAPAAASVPSEGSFKFSKNKMLGYLTYKTIHTEVDVDHEKLTIKKKTKLFGIPLKDKSVTLQKHHLAGIKVERKIDIIDLIYVGGFGLLTLVSLVYNFVSYDPNWIMTLIFAGIAALCYWTGYGKVIEIATNGDKPILIATSGNQNEEDFVRTVQA